MTTRLSSARHDCESASMFTLVPCGFNPEVTFLASLRVLSQVWTVALVPGRMFSTSSQGMPLGGFQAGNLAFNRRACAAVTHIAAKHGFDDLGRFVLHYRKAFAEHPSTILRS